MKTYRMKRGDTLFKVAQTFYGDGYKYKKLAEYNGLKNPNALEVGQVISIPDESELNDSLSAWHHYKNGSIWWRVTAKGVEIKGKGYLKNRHYTQQAKKIWETYREPILAASKKHGVPLPVIIATISTESSGVPKAYRHEPAFYERYIKNKSQWKNNPYYHSSEKISASYGLMQIMYTTAYNVGFHEAPEDLYDPERNIDAGCAYIASSFQRKQHDWDPPKIACAYNAGSVRPTRKNPWGMFHYKGHLARWIPSYNGAIESLETTMELPEIVPKPTEVEQPQPQPRPEAEEVKELVMLRFMFSQEEGQPWKPLIVDAFKHDENGIGDPFSFNIEAVSAEQDGGYSHDLPNIAKGVYDFVFTDAATSSVVHDLAEELVEENPSIVDLRGDADVEPEVLSGKATVRIQFPKAPGQVWKPFIIDMFEHKDGNIGEPRSYTVKMPSHGPGGTYIYEIPDVPYGTYDFVFTDANTRSVVNDITDYEVRQTLCVIDLDPGDSRAALSPDLAPPSSRGLGAILKEFWAGLWGR